MISNRLDRGLKQRSAAAMLGACEETISNWESGRITPPVKHRPGLVEFLGYDPVPVGSDLASRLGAAHQRLALIQEAFDATVGLDAGSVGHWERGSRPPSRRMARRVGAILVRLEATSQELAGGCDTVVEQASPSYFDRTRWRRAPPPNLTAGNPQSLGDTLRQRRLELGLSHAEAGMVVRVSRSTLHRWERNKYAPASMMIGVWDFLKEDAEKVPRPPQAHSDSPPHSTRSSWQWPRV